MASPWISPGGRCERRRIDEGGRGRSTRIGSAMTGPPAFQDLHRQALRGTRQQQQSQRRRRDLELRLERAEQEHWPPSGVRGQLHAAQVLGARARLRQPGEQRPEAAALQRLLDGPQAIGGVRGLDDEQVVGIDAVRGQRRRVRDLRRTEQDDETALAREPPQQRHEQAQLADARLAADQLGEHAGGPAGAGQFGIERGEAAREGVNGCGADPAGPPDGIGQGRRGHACLTACRRAAARRRCLRARRHRCGRRRRSARNRDSRAAVRWCGRAVASA